MEEETERLKKQMDKEQVSKAPRETLPQGYFFNQKYRFRPYNIDGMYLISDDNPLRLV